MSAQLSRWEATGGTPSLSSFCFQRLLAIQQVLKAQKISFLLRGGVRVLVAMRDTDTGEKPGASPGLAVLAPAGSRGVHPRPPGDAATTGAGAEDPSGATRSSWLDPGQSPGFK